MQPQFEMTEVRLTSGEYVVVVESSDNKTKARFEVTLERRKRESWKPGKNLKHPGKNLLRLEEDARKAIKNFCLAVCHTT